MSIPFHFARLLRKLLAAAPLAAIVAALPCRQPEPPVIKASISCPPRPSRSRLRCSAMAWPRRPTTVSLAHQQGRTYVVSLRDDPCRQARMDVSRPDRVRRRSAIERHHRSSSTSSIPRSSVASRPPSARAEAGRCRRNWSSASIGRWPRNASMPPPGRPSRPSSRSRRLSVMAARRDGFDPAYAIDLVLAAIRAQPEQVGGLPRNADADAEALQMPTQAETIEFVKSGLDDLESGRARPLVCQGLDRKRLRRARPLCAMVRLHAQRQRSGRHEAPARRSQPAPGGGHRLLHSNGRQVFAAVGSLHDPGPTGLPALLRQRGYKVEQGDFRAEGCVDDAAEVRRRACGRPCSSFDGSPCNGRFALLRNFADPAASEAAFRRALSQSPGLDDELTLQAADRAAYGLRSRSGEAHALHSTRSSRAWPPPGPSRACATSSNAAAPGAPRRRSTAALRGGGEHPRRPSRRARRCHAREVALVEPAAEAQLAWNLRALAVAAASSDPIARNWDASLANGIGMSLHEAATAKRWPASRPRWRRASASAIRAAFARRAGWSRGRCACCIATTRPWRS